MHSRWQLHTSTVVYQVDEITEAATKWRMGRITWTKRDSTSRRTERKGKAQSFHHNTPNGPPFKIYELFTSGIFHLMFLDWGGLQVTETMAAAEGRRRLYPLVPKSSSGTFKMSLRCLSRGVCVKQNRASRTSGGTRKVKHPPAKAGDMGSFSDPSLVREDPSCHRTLNLCATQLTRSPRNPAPELRSRSHCKGNPTGDQEKPHLPQEKPLSSRKGSVQPN